MARAREPRGEASASLDVEMDMEDAGGEEQEFAKPGDELEFDSSAVEDEPETAAEDGDTDLDVEGEGEPGSEDLEEIEDEGVDEVGVPDSELGDDPVRMYLKEIGQVRLLDADQEIWLATQMAAEKRLALVRQANDEANPAEWMLGLFDDLDIGWKNGLEGVRLLKHDPPDLRLLVAEARNLRQDWRRDDLPFVPAGLAGQRRLGPRRGLGQSGRAGL